MRAPKKQKKVDELATTSSTKPPIIVKLKKRKSNNSLLAGGHPQENEMRRPGSYLSKEMYQGGDSEPDIGSQNQKQLDFESRIKGSTDSSFIEMLIKSTDQSKGYRR